MNSIGQLLALFTKGEQVANPAAWQSAQVAGTALGGVILAGINLANAFGYHLPAGLVIDSSTANEVGASAVVLFNLALSAVSHAHIGVGAKK